MHRQSTIDSFLHKNSFQGKCETNQSINLSESIVNTNAFHHTHWSTFLWNDRHALRPKHTTNRHTLSVVDVLNIDIRVALCAITHYYVFEFANISTVDKCKDISKHIEWFCQRLESNESKNTMYKPIIRLYFYLASCFGTFPIQIKKIVEKLFPLYMYETVGVHTLAPELLAPHPEKFIREHPHVLVEMFGIHFESVQNIAVRHKWWTHCSSKQIHTYIHDYLNKSSDTCLYWKNGKVFFRTKNTFVDTNDDTQCSDFQRTWDTIQEEYTSKDNPCYKTFFTTPSKYRAENTISSIHNEFISNPLYTESPFDKSFCVQNTCAIPLDEHQTSIVESFLSPEQMCMIIQGGAGTGKTQLGVCAVLEYNIHFNVPVLWCAPTHEATLNAKRRMQKYCDASSVRFSTLHSFIGKMDVQYHKYREMSNNTQSQSMQIYDVWKQTKTTDDTIPRVLVIDECSMLSSELFAKVIEHIHHFRIQKVLLLGDKHQLEPVDAGRPFADLQDLCNVHTGHSLLPTLCVLHQNYRSEGKGIIEMCHNVIDPHFMWTFEHDVEDNTDVTFHKTTTDENTSVAVENVIKALVSNGALPATTLRVHPNENASSFHVITPNNHHVMIYANLVRQNCFKKNEPQNTLCVNDVVRFDKNRVFYQNGTLGEVLFVKPEKHLLIRIHTDTETNHNCKKGCNVGILSVLQNDTFVRHIYTTRGIKTSYPIWKAEYLDIAHHPEHPLFYKTFFFVYSHLLTMLKTTHSTNATVLKKEIQNVYWRSIDPKKRNVILVCKDVVCIPTNQSEGKLAYASTIHKAQGGEADYVLCIMPPSMRYCVNRNLAYTAFSRARKHLYLIGTCSSFQKCNASPQKRITLMPHLMEDKISQMTRTRCAGANTLQ